MGKRETFYEGVDNSENVDLDVSNTDLPTDSQNIEIDSSIPMIQSSDNSILPTPSISLKSADPTPISIVVSKNDETTLSPSVPQNVSVLPQSVSTLPPIDISKIATTPYSTYVTEPPQEIPEEQTPLDTSPELDYGMTPTPLTEYTTTEVPQVTEEPEVTLAPQETTTPFSQDMPVSQDTTSPFPQDTTTLTPYQGTTTVTPASLTTTFAPAFPTEPPYYSPDSTDTGYKAFDPLSFDIDNYEYIAKVNKSTQPDGLSDNPMDPNWGGVMYTQKVLSSGKYDENIITKPVLFQPKGIFIDGIPSPFDKPKDIL